MIELKQEIDELCRRLGEPPRHGTVPPLFSVSKYNTETSSQEPTAALMDEPDSQDKD